MSPKNNQNGNGEKKPMMTSSAKDEEPVRRGRLARFLIGFLSIVLAGFFLAVLVGFWAFRSLRTSVDLGVAYSYSDYQNFIEKAGFALEGEDRQFCFLCPVEYSGQINTDFQLTSAEASSWFEAVNAEMGPISGTQILIEEGRVSVSTNVSYQGLSYPVFATGLIAKSGPRSVSIKIEKAKIGKVSLPVGAVPKIEKELENFTNRKLAEIEGLEIQELELKPGYLHFKGTLPEKISPQN